MSQINGRRNSKVIRCRRVAQIKSIVKKEHIKATTIARKKSEPCSAKGQNWIARQRLAVLFLLWKATNLELRPWRERTTNTEFGMERPYYIKAYGWLCMSVEPGLSHHTKAMSVYGDIHGFVMNPWMTNANTRRK